MLRELIKKIPFSKTVYRVFRPETAKSSFEFSRSNWASSDSPKVITRTRILNILNFTKTSGSSYAATSHPAAYHQIEINGEVYQGQRKPGERLDLVPLNFSGKTVLDIGCNQGGMIFALGDAPRWAVGLDFDPHMINACNLIKSQLPSRDMNFFVFDIDRDPHGLIRDFLPEDKVDVVFLLSVCMWVERWRELIDLISSITETLIFETNGSDEQQSEQVEYLRSRFTDVTMLASESNDDPSQKRRQFYLLSGGKS